MEYQYKAKFLGVLLKIKTPRKWGVLYINFRFVDYPVAVEFVQ